MKIKKILLIGFAVILIVGAIKVYQWRLPRKTREVKEIKKVEIKPEVKAEIVKPILSEAIGREIISTDGKKALFTFNAEIWVMNIDGSNKKQLTHTPETISSTRSSTGREYAYADYPYWSPDGKKVLFSIIWEDGHQTFNRDIWAINADGTNQTQLTNTPDRFETDAEWLSDEKIVFRVPEEKREITLTLKN
ncbi:hypothetical protein L6386_05845 [bacterium]|nr:hypothetical protein [bacterium]MBU4561598.1 hypothetical protein [bacterium]MCG2676619.1 hypothetical protein [bacterium]MCG2678061.1 hypothetical protein [bacterium]